MEQGTGQNNRRGGLGGGVVQEVELIGKAVQAGKEGVVFFPACRGVEPRRSDQFDLIFLDTSPQAHQCSAVSLLGEEQNKWRCAECARGARFGGWVTAKLGRGAGEVLPVLSPGKARARGQRRRKQVAS